MKKVLAGTALSFLCLILIALPVLAAYTVNFSLTESAGVSYPMLAIGVSVNNTSLANKHYISASGLDVQVLNSGTAVPRMVTDNATYFAVPVPGNTTMYLQETGGNTPSTSFNIIPGFGGYITTADNASLELGSAFEISISGYFDTAAGEDKIIAYKPGVFMLDVSDEGTITFHAKDGGDGDVWTLGGTAATGVHTVQVSCTGLAARLYIDSVEADAQSLMAMSNTIIQAGDCSERNNSSKRLSFYAAERYWVFYEKGSSNEYRSSSDGQSWSAATILGTASIPYVLSVWYQDPYVHYVRDSGNTAQFLYRRGTPQADGSISWDSNEQTVSTWPGGGVGVYGAIYSASLAVDSAGYPFVSIWIYNGARWVVKSGTNNGTFTAVDIAQIGSDLTSQLDESWHTIVPLPGGYMYHLRKKADTSGTVYGRLYTPGGWAGSDTTIDTAGANIASISATVDSAGEIHAIWTLANGSTQYARRDIGGAWTVPVEIAASVYASSISVSTASDAVFVWYAKSDGIYLRVGDLQGIFDAPQRQFTVTPQNSKRMMSSSFSDYGSKIIVSYIDNTSSLQVGHASFSWSWSDTEYDYYWMVNNSMPYADNITMSVQGTPRLKYQPISMIQGTTLPDQTGNGQTGTIHFGGAINLPNLTTTITEVSAGPYATAPPYTRGPSAGQLFPESTATSNFGSGNLLHVIIAGIVVLGASLATSALLRQLGSGSLIIKSAVIVGTMGIFVAIPNQPGVPSSGTWLDFWMIVFFLMMATAIMMGSKQVSW